MKKYSPSPSTPPSVPQDDLGREYIEISSESSDDEQPNPLKRTNAVTGKSLMTYNHLRMDNGERPVIDLVDYDDRPNLEEYFSNFNLSAQERIKLCRSYASYLTRAAGIQIKRRKL